MASGLKTTRTIPHAIIFRDFIIFAIRIVLELGALGLIIHASDGIFVGD